MYSGHKESHIPQPSEDTIVASNPFDEQPCGNSSQLGMASASFRGGMPHPMMMLHMGQNPMFRGGGMGGPPMHRGFAPMYPGMLPPGHPGGLSSLNGRVYPSDQPMIFSSTNPNAPPIFPCGLCHKEIHDNDQAIMCEGGGCNFWYHRICTGLTEDAFKLLQAEPCAEWVCDKCFMEKNVPLVKFK